MDELDQAIYTRLTGGTALTALLSGTAAVYSGLAPQGAALPYIVYNQQSGGDENLTPSRSKSYLYQIQIYSGVSQAAAWAIDAQVDALLHGYTFAVGGGWTNWWTAKDGELPLIETKPNGDVVYSVRSLYRIKLGV